MENKKILKKVVATTLAVAMTTFSVSPVFAYTKDETVYSKLNSNGESYKTVVDDHLQNTDENQTLKDLSELLGITNVNGDETYDKNGNNLDWKANGNDIYYQGNTDKELPLDCNIKYELDGNEISPNDLLGKSGKVKISIEYKNNDAHIVNINGTDTTMYTPFVVVSGTMLDNTKAKNIKMTNGKIVDNGQKTLLLGITCPGMKESLAIKDSSDINFTIPEKLEIEFDAENFEMENIISYATPKILEDTDITNLDKLDDLYSDVTKLSDSSKQIVDGATTLQSGTQSLASGTQTLVNGTTTAYNGSSKIESEVQKSINSLQSDNSEALDKATLNQIGAQAKSQATLSDTQKSQIGSQAESVATATVNSQLSAIASQAANTAKSNIANQESTIEANAVSGVQLTSAQKAALQTAMQQSLANYSSSYNNLTASEQAELIAVISSTMNTAVQNSLDNAASQVAYGTAQNIAQQTASSTAKSTALSVAGQVSNSTAQSVASQTAQTTAEETAIVTARTVANQVKASAQNSVVSQMTTLRNGLASLTSGLNDIREGTVSLSNGADQIAQGAQTLQSGITTFDEEGIQKIANLVNGDVKDLQTRIEKLKELANNYNSYSGKDENAQGKVKFIFITDSIKSDEDKNTSSIIPSSITSRNSDSNTTTNETTSD